MKRRRSGFTLIEVLAAFIIALVLIAPISNIIGGAAGAMVGLDRSSMRRGERQAASAAAALAPLRPGTRQVGDYQVTIRPHEHEAARDLAGAGWRLFDVAVSSPSTGAVIVETLRLGRLQ